MWLSVEHRTRFEYDAPIVEAHTELRLKPAHRAGQRCSSFAMEMEPRGASVDEHFDRFANCVHSFDLLDQHSELVVTARSEVWTPERYEDDVAAVAARPLGPAARVAVRARSTARWRSSRARSRQAGRARDGARAGQRRCASR